MTTPLIVFPDVEGDLKDFYTAFVAGRSEDYAQGVAVHVRVPTDRPARLVAVRRAGGVSQQFGLDTVRFDIQVWHDSDTSAHDLAALLRAATWTARGFRSFRGMRESGGLIPVPDTDGSARYMFTPEFTVKGATP